ncbi:hypothetical protein RI367_005439 [Sorochytrium milnesiophthora]
MRTTVSVLFCLSLLSLALALPFDDILPGELGLAGDKESRPMMSGNPEHPVPYGPSEGEGTSNEKPGFHVDTRAAAPQDYGQASRSEAPVDPSQTSWGPLTGSFEPPDNWASFLANIKDNKVIGGGSATKQASTSSQKSSEQSPAKDASGGKQNSVKDSTPPTPKKDGLVSRFKKAFSRNINRGEEGDPDREPLLGEEDETDTETLEGEEIGEETKDAIRRALKTFRQHPGAFKLHLGLVSPELSLEQRTTEALNIPTTSQAQAEAVYKRLPKIVRDTGLVTDSDRMLTAAGFR